jgi:hypothetical protein
MTEWLVDGASFLVLFIGMRLGQPRFLRAMCTLAVIYLIIFAVVYFLWLKWKLHYFDTHPQMIHLGISAAFGFEGFWKLFANMLLLQGIMPEAGIFLVYFAIKWLSASVGPTSRFFS